MDTPTGTTRQPDWANALARGYLLLPILSSETREDGVSVIVPVVGGSLALFTSRDALAAGGLPLLTRCALVTPKELLDAWGPGTAAVVDPSPEGGLAVELNLVSEVWQSRSQELVLGWERATV